MSNIISLNEFKRQLKQETARPSDIRAELDFRTEKLLQVLDEQQGQIDSLQKTLTSLIRALKTLNDKA